jgi:hypothetical protein
MLKDPNAVIVGRDDCPDREVRIPVGGRGMSAMLQRLALKAWARLEGFPTEWYDRQRLLDWERAHADPAGDVWAISFVGDAWDLYRPGSPKEGPYSYEGVEPADQDRDWDCHCKDKTHQASSPAPRLGCGRWSHDPPQRPVAHRRRAARRRRQLRPRLAGRTQREIGR